DQAGWLGRARLHVNPLRYGGGPEQGFLNSLAAGLPFVTTSVGAESLPLGDLRNSLVADSPVRLASLISGLYDDRSESEMARARLLELGGTCFDRGSFERTLLEAMTHVGLAS